MIHYQFEQFNVDELFSNNTNWRQMKWRRMSNSHEMRTNGLSGCVTRLLAAHITATVTALMLLLLLLNSPHRLLRQPDVSFSSSLWHSLKTFLLLGGYMWSRRTVICHITHMRLKHIYSLTVPDIGPSTEALHMLKNLTFNVEIIRLFLQSLINLYLFERPTFRQTFHEATVESLLL